MSGGDSVGIDPGGLIGLPIQIPSLWTLARTEVSRPAAEVGPHADLIAWIENIEQPVKGTERLLPQFSSQLAFDGSDHFALSLKVLGSPEGERHFLLTSTGRGIGDRYVSPIVQMTDDLARTLAGNAQFPADVRDRRSSRIRAQSQHSTVGKPAFVESSVRHGPIQAALVTEPSTAQGRTEGKWRRVLGDPGGTRGWHGVVDVHRAIR